MTPLLSTHHPTPLPWSTACGLILALTHLGYPRPSVSYQKQDFLPILNGSSATYSRCRFLALLCYPRRHQPDFGLWLFSWKDQANLYTLQGMKIKLSQHIPLQHQICSDNKAARGPWVVLQHRTLGCRWRLGNFKSLPSNSVYFHISSMVTSSKTTLQNWRMSENREGMKKVQFGSYNIVMGTKV